MILLSHGYHLSIELSQVELMNKLYTLSVILTPIDELHVVVRNVSQQNRPLGKNGNNTNTTTNS